MLRDALLTSSSALYVVDLVRFRQVGDVGIPIEC